MNRKQVRTLVEGYVELQAAKDTWGPGYRVLIDLATITQGFKKLPPEQRKILFYCGVCKHKRWYPTADGDGARTYIDLAQDHLGYTKYEIHDAYVGALDALVNILGGGA